LQEVLLWLVVDQISQSRPTVEAEMLYYLG